jgi:hypothetical protein
MVFMLVRGGSVFNIHRCKKVWGQCFNAPTDVRWYSCWRQEVPDSTCIDAKKGVWGRCLNASACHTLGARGIARGLLSRQLRRLALASALLTWMFSMWESLASLHMTWTSQIWSVRPDSSYFVRWVMKTNSRSSAFMTLHENAIFVLCTRDA